MFVSRRRNKRGNRSRSGSGNRLWSGSGSGSKSWSWSLSGNVLWSRSESGKNNSK